MQAYHKKDMGSLIENSVQFLRMIQDLDMILATNKNFLLGVWLEDAKSIPQGNTYKMMESYLYEFNAKNQITLWGPNGEILDYATKQWSGLVKDYYFPRWELFFDRLMFSVKSNVTFNYEEYKYDFIEYIGKPFTLDRSLYPTQPIGDTIYVAKKLYRRWRHEFDAKDQFWISYNQLRQCGDEDDEQH